MPTRVGCERGTPAVTVPESPRVPVGSARGCRAGCPFLSTLGCPVHGSWGPRSWGAPILGIWGCPKPRAGWGGSLQVPGGDALGLVPGAGAQPGGAGGIWGAAGGFGCRIKGRGGSEHPALGDRAHPGDTERTVPCRAVPNCAVLFCAITCCAMPNCAVPSCAVPCRAELCRAVPGLAGPRRRRQGWGLSGGFVICSSLIPRRDFCLPLSRSTAEII